MRPFQVREQPPEWKYSTSASLPPPALLPEPFPRKEPCDAPFLLPDWAATTWPSLPSLRQAARDLEASLRALRVAEACISRRIGDGLRRIRDGHIDPIRLGELSYRTFALNWLGISPTQASDLAGLSASLEKWPRLSAAYDAGFVSRSQAQVVRHVLEPETEAGWVALASKTPVRQLKKWVDRYRNVEKGIAPDEKMEGVTLEMGPEDLQHFLLTGKEMMEKVVGHAVSNATLFQDLMAEWVGANAEKLPPPAEEEDSGPEPEPKKENKREEPMPDLPTGEDAALGEEAAPCLLDRIPDPREAKGIDELLEVLLQLTGMRQSLDWQAGHALNLGRRFRLIPDALGILGVSARTAAYLCRVDDDLEIFPAVKEAYLKGRLGWAKVDRVLRICEPGTEAAWVKRAEELTVIGLEHEVGAMVGFRRLSEDAWRERTGGLPPDADLLRQLRVLPGRNRAADLDALLQAANVRRAGSVEKEARGRSWKPVGRIRLTKTRLRVPAGVATLWYGVQFALVQELRTVDHGKMLRHLVDHFLEVYEAEHKALGGKHPIHERGSYACGFPGCWKRVCEDDHVIAKSQGGSDDPSNRHTLCAGHHRIAKHLGLAKVWGKAPHDIWFQIGRRIWKDNRLVRVEAAR